MKAQRTLFQEKHTHTITVIEVMYVLFLTRVADKLEYDFYDQKVTRPDINKMYDFQ